MSRHVAKIIIKTCGAGNVEIVGSVVIVVTVSENNTFKLYICEIACHLMQRKQIENSEAHWK